MPLSLSVCWSHASVTQESVRNEEGEEEGEEDPGVVWCGIASTTTKHNFVMIIPITNINTYEQHISNASQSKTTTKVYT